MTLVYSFLFCGLICLIGQIILDNTSFTPGHITTLLVVIGAALGIFNLYDQIASVVGAGANVPIMSFGNVLVGAAYEGYQQMGFLGLIGNMLSSVSVGIVSAVVIALIMVMIAKVKD